MEGSTRKGKVNSCRCVITLAQACEIIQMLYDTARKSKVGAGPNCVVGQGEDILLFFFDRAALATNF